jgi:hypothetical protein
MWRFVVDVTYPLISVDFLFQFGLLVDCQYSRLLNAVTSPVPAQPARSLIPSVKNMSGDTLVHDLLAKFLDLLIVY